MYDEEPCRSEDCNLGKSALECGQPCLSRGDAIAFAQDALRGLAWALGLMVNVHGDSSPNDDPIVSYELRSLEDLKLHAEFLYESFAGETATKRRVR